MTEDLKAKIAEAITTEPLYLTAEQAARYGVLSVIVRAANQSQANRDRDGLIYRAMIQASQPKTEDQPK